MNALVRLVISVFAAIAMVVVAMVVVAATAHAQEPSDASGLDSAQNESTPPETPPDITAHDEGPPVDEPASANDAPATEPASDYLAPAEEPALSSSDPIEEGDQPDPSAEDDENAGIAGENGATDDVIATTEAVADSEETVAQSGRRRGSTIAPDFETDPLAAVEQDAASALRGAVEARVEEALGSATEARAAAEEQAAAAVESALDDAAAAVASAQGSAAEAQAAAQDAAEAAQAQAAAAQEAAQEQAAAAQEAAAEQAQSALPDADTIQDMIDVLLDVRAQIDDPDGQQLIDDAIEILLEALADAQAAEQANNGGAQNGNTDGGQNGSNGGAQNGSNNTTSPDTGDANATANSGDTGDVTSDSVGIAVTGNTGDSTANASATSGGDDPPDGGGGGTDPPTDPPACDETAADNPAAVSASTGSADQCSGEPGGFSGAPIDVAAPCRTVAAGSNDDDRTVAWFPVLPGQTVAQTQTASKDDLAYWWSLLRCPDEKFGADEPGTTSAACSSAACAPETKHDGAGVAALDGGATAAGQSAYTYKVIGEESFGAFAADELSAVSTATDGPSGPTGTPTVPTRKPIAVVQSSGSLNPFGNSGTAQPSFQTGSALAYVSPWLAPNVVLSYDRGTASSTDNVSSRSDEPPTPPG